MDGGGHSEGTSRERSCYQPKGEMKMRYGAGCGRVGGEGKREDEEFGAR